MKNVVIVKTVLLEIEVDDDVTFEEINKHIASEYPGYEILDIYNPDEDFETPS